MLHFITVMMCLAPVLSHHPGPLRKAEWISTAECSLKWGKQFWEPCATGSASIGLNDSNQDMNETWMFPGPVKVTRAPLSAAVSFPRVQSSNISTLPTKEQAVIYMLLTQDSEDEWYCLDKSSENHLQVNIPIPTNALLFAVGRNGLLVEHEVSFKPSVVLDPSLYIGVAIALSLILLLIGVSLVSLAVFRPTDDEALSGRQVHCSCLRLYLKLIHHKFGERHGPPCEADSGLPMLRRLLTEREIASVPRAQNPSRTISLPSVWLPPGAMSPQQPKLRTAMSEPDISSTAWKLLAPVEHVAQSKLTRLDADIEENKSWMAKVYSIEVNLNADIDLSKEDLLDSEPQATSITSDRGLHLSPAHCSQMTADPLATSTCQVSRIHTSLIQVPAAEPSPVPSVQPQMLKFSDLEAPIYNNIPGLDTTVPANQTGTSDISSLSNPASPPMPTYPPPPLPSDVNANDLSMCSTKTEHLDGEVAEILKQEYSSFPSGAPSQSNSATTVEASPGLCNTKSSMTTEYVPLLLPHQMVVNADIHFTEPEMESECMEERLIINLLGLNETETMA